MSEIVKYARKIKGILSLVSFILSLVASSPIISRFLIYYLYEPMMEIYLSPPLPSFREVSELNMSIVLKSGVQILNLDHKHDLQIRIEFISSKPLKPKLSSIEGSLSGRGFRYVITESFYVPARGTLCLTFPFEPYSEKFTLEVIVYARIKLSEFGFPVFFGEVDLRPIRRKFIIRP